MNTPNKDKLIEDFLDAGGIQLDDNVFQGTESDLERFAALVLSAARAEQEPAAWMTDDDRVVSAKTKAAAERDGGAMRSSLRPYKKPLYLSPPSSDQVHNDAIEAAKSAVKERAVGDEIFVQNAVDAIDSLKRPSQAQEPCKHPNSKCIYESDDGEFERHECPDCGARFGVEIPQ